MTDRPPPFYPGRVFERDAGNKRNTGRKMTYYRNMMGPRNDVIEKYIKHDKKYSLRQLRIKTRFTDAQNVDIMLTFILLLICGICYHISAVFLSLSMKERTKQTDQFPKEYDFWIQSFFVFLGMIVVPCLYLGICLAHSNDAMTHPELDKVQEKKVVVNTPEEKTLIDSLKKILTDRSLLLALTLFTGVALAIYFAQSPSPQIPIEKAFTDLSDDNPVVKPLDFTRKHGRGYFTLTVIYAVVSLAVPILMLNAIRGVITCTVLNNKLEPDKIIIQNNEHQRRVLESYSDKDVHRLLLYSIDSDGGAIGPRNETEGNARYYMNINGLLGTQSKAGFFYYPVEGLPKDIALAENVLGQYPTGFRLVNWDFFYMFIFEFVFIIISLIIGAICFLCVFHNVKSATKHVDYNPSAFTAMSIFGFVFCMVVLVLCAIWAGNVIRKMTN